MRNVTFTGDDRDQLATLYEARGREIERLKNELDSFREKKEQDDRLARHEIAILKADKDKCKAKLNELEDLYQNGQFDEKALRDEVKELRETNAKMEREKLEVCCGIIIKRNTSKITINTFALCRY